LTRNTLNETWIHILNALQTRLNNPSVETWLKAMKPVTFIDDSLIIEVTDKFSRDWLADRYGPVIKSILYDFLEQEMNVEFILHHELSGRIVNRNKRNSVSYTDDSPYHLNTKYTFDTFVVLPMPPPWRWQILLQNLITLFFFMVVWDWEKPT